VKKFFLTNTLTGKKEEFAPEKNDISLYACGITPYDFSHIGHGRSYVFVDVLVRFLRFCGYNVKYVRNITDIDDKLLKKAELSGDIMSYLELSEKFTEQYQEEMRALNNLDPNIEPKVTENIDKIIDFIKKLIEKKKAYVIDGDVYFDVTSYEKYGELSGKKLEDLLAGARVKVDERKRNPADFALWKGNDKKLFWESPWGYGRPGWHIECSALVKDCLDETIDIHCGGMDLVFPHHENERAQSESLHGNTFVRFWVHNALLNIDKEKMSKSLGNILSLHEIFEKYDPMILRYYFLQHHYRTPIDFGFDRLEAAKVAYKKLVAVFEDVPRYAQASLKLRRATRDERCQAKMIDALSDDLNTPRVLGVVFENLPQIREDKNLSRCVKSFLQEVLGLTFAPIKEEKIEITPEIEKLIKDREYARKEKNWVLADSIRDRLRELGYEVQDRKS